MKTLDQKLKALPESRRAKIEKRAVELILEESARQKKVPEKNTPSAGRMKRVAK